MPKGGAICEHDGKMGIGWGGWSWAIAGANIVGGKGFTCALSRGFNGKMLNWDLTFAQKARGW